MPKGNNIGNIKDMDRFKEIMSVIRKNGLGFIFVKTALSRNPQKELVKEHQKEGSLPVAQRVRMCCEELGPTFVKLGQIMSTRADIIPEDVAKELQKLQDEVPAIPFAEARVVMETSLQDKIENIFVDFNEEPVASASVSQVYRARLHSGAKVAVKVSRPNIAEIVEVDLKILLRLARFIDRHTKYGRLYDFESMVKELRLVMEQEMDFIHEGGNIDRFRHNLERDENISAPKVHWVYTTKHVLTMDYAEGVKINDVAALDRMGVDKRKLASDFANSMLKQILVDGFFHADPHPGNVMVTGGGRIEFIDLGMAGSLSEHFRRQLNEMFLGIATRNVRKIAHAIMDMDAAGADVDKRSFINTLNTMLDEYIYSPMGNFNIAQLFTSVFALAGDYKMIIAKEFALVAKALATAQSIIELLAPNASIFDIAGNTISGIKHDLLFSKDTKSTLDTMFMDSVDAATRLPAYLSEFLRKTEENDYVIEFKIKQLEKLDKDFERMVNRISFTVVLLAVCIVIAGVLVAMGLQTGTGDDLYEISSIGLFAGLIIAAAIVFGLVFNMIYTNIKK